MKLCWTLEGADVVSAVTRLIGSVTHCADRDIMARRGDSWATDACLLEHWRDVENREETKPQSKTVSDL